jgi:ribonuclease HI
MGALVAAEFCRELGLREIILEGDSKLVVEAILLKAPSRSTYGHIVGDILEVLKVFRSWAARSGSCEEGGKCGGSRATKRRTYGV